MNKLAIKDDIKTFLTLVRDRGEIIAKYRDWNGETKFVGVRIDASGAIFAKFIISQKIEHIPVPAEILNEELLKVEEAYKMLVEIPVTLFS
jgi:hypothetical protein